MKSKLVVLNFIRRPVWPSPGFAKRWFFSYKLDILRLCNFGCLYCS